MKVYYGCQKTPIKPKRQAPIHPKRRKRPRKELVFVPYLDDLEPKKRIDLRLLWGGFLTER